MNRAYFAIAVDACDSDDVAAVQTCLAQLAKNHFVMKSARVEYLGTVLRDDRINVISTQGGVTMNSL